MHLPVGITLQGGKYEIVRYISSGGFGCTYEARHTMLNTTVAIKEFFVKDYCNRDAQTYNITVATQGKQELIERLRRKFIEEAQAIFNMNHPNIVRVTDIFQENGTVYYVMDYIDGSSLAAKIAEKGKLAESESLGYIRQVADALSYVHSQNRLHLDVKPQNIMIDQSGKAVLIDFGVSKQYDEVNGENTSTLLGSTPGYAPIEQSGNGIVRFYPSADIYALGATLYKALTGTTPIAAHLRASGEELEPLPAVITEPTRVALDAAMQINKAHRPQSVEEFLSLLESKDERVQSTDNRERRTDNREQGEELIDDADVEVTVAPDKRVQRTDNRVQRVNAKAVEAENEETRAVEKEPEKVAVTNNEPPSPNKNRTVWVVAVLGVLIVCGLFFALSGGDGSDYNSSYSSDYVGADYIEQSDYPVDDISEQGISTQKKVDLGLDVCWAGWNVGASSPEGYGDYYAWGETTTKSNYSESSYQYHNGSDYANCSDNAGYSDTGYSGNVNDSDNAGYSDNVNDSDYVNIGSNISGTHYDVARAQWGDSWRMPTDADFQELIDRCTWTWTTYKGVNGYKVTGPNGNSIFLPAAGYRNGTELFDRGSYGIYWSGSLNEILQSDAYYLTFVSGDLNAIRDRSVYSLYRERGLTVRPVCDK